MKASHEFLGAQASLYACFVIGFSQKQEGKDACAPRAFHRNRGAAFCGCAKPRPSPRCAARLYNSIPSARSEMPMPRDLNNVRSSLAVLGCPAATTLARDLTFAQPEVSAPKYSINSRERF